MHQTKPESHYKHRVHGRYKAEGCHNFCILSHTSTGEKKENYQEGRLWSRRWYSRMSVYFTWLKETSRGRLLTYHWCIPMSMNHGRMSWTASGRDTGINIWTTWVKPCQVLGIPSGTWCSLWGSWLLLVHCCHLPSPELKRFHPSKSPALSSHPSGPLLQPSLQLPTLGSWLSLFNQHRLWAFSVRHLWTYKLPALLLFEFEITRRHGWWELSHKHVSTYSWTQIFRF